ncbi:MAG TPA: helix-turn-helix domain-containing protein [Acidimicrobiales bacterium]
MSPADTTAATPEGDLPLEAMVLTRPQTRVVHAARDLFTEHGVRDTSLLMIAERLGVTKAAIYFQFKTKEEIVLATATAEMLSLRDLLDAAEADPARGRDLVLDVIIGFVVDRRQRPLLIQSDPTMLRLITEHQQFDALLKRLHRTLTGESTPRARARCVMLGAAIDAALTHPLVAGLDDDDLSAELHSLAHGALDHLAGS